MIKIVVEFDNVLIVFGDVFEKVLLLMDVDKFCVEVKIEIGQVLGVYDCLLSVNEGEIFVLMGLLGFGKFMLLWVVNVLNFVVWGCVCVSDGEMLVDVINVKVVDLCDICQMWVVMVF